MRLFRNQLRRISRNSPVDCLPTPNSEEAKKRLGSRINDKQMLIETKHPTLSIARQCELLDLARSSLYYRPSRDDEYNEFLMRLIDEQYTRTPFYGARRMRHCLARQGQAVNHKRVRRLMRQMGIAAIYPKPRLSAPDKQHRKYPYLLGSL